MSREQRSQLIAMVYDDKSVQSALQDLIESEGLSTPCFGSAEQFLDSEWRYKAACLIADVRMPGMSGLATLRPSDAVSQLRKKIEKDSTHPVYILTEPWMGYRFQSPDMSAYKNSRRKS